MNLASHNAVHYLTCFMFTCEVEDAFTYHLGQRFSTKDRDNDFIFGSCAQMYRGGWWYGKCHKSNMNGVYGSQPSKSGIVAYSWKGFHDQNLVQTSMMIRPYKHVGPHRENYPRLID